ncbi:hypothetical protein PGT21_004783 [Puccinia graminis f. sp. tritici]|uniref:Uncharacterized protein n=2 Tax=Puccinia graminis f. sp. tritici TaxID=56615 RepID=A0A5B0PQG1_PUCGR|nr:hypothetical protein PGTUg99_022128 [Puccinia graminis f. sp. tritici]KAA1103927.1 hypothetical protein PGT21_004783 [Puccinia graminis f. sp. tritici]
MKTFLLLIPIVSQFLVTLGMHPSGQELAALGQDSSNGCREGMSPPRMVELVPVDGGVSIDMPAYDHVSSYDKMIREYNAQHHIPPPEDRSMVPYNPTDRAGRDTRIQRPGSAITRTRDGDDRICTKGYMIGWGAFGLGVVIVVVVLLLKVLHPEADNGPGYQTTAMPSPRRGL